MAVGLVGVFAAMEDAEEEKARGAREESFWGFWGFCRAGWTEAEGRVLEFGVQIRGMRG